MMADLKLVLGDFDEIASYAHDKSSQHLSGFFGEAKPAPDFYTVLLRMEQTPNPDSRVKLADERDALGVQRVAVHWALADGEKEGVRRTVARIGEIIGAMAVGRLQLANWLAEAEAPFPSWIDGDYHHIGSTRMADAPTSGVVDWDGRVHVCPTSTWRAVRRSIRAGRQTQP